MTNPCKKLQEWDTKTNPDGTVMDFVSLRVMNVCNEPITKFHVFLSTIYAFLFFSFSAPSQCTCLCLYEYVVEVRIKLWYIPLSFSDCSQHPFSASLRENNRERTGTKSAGAQSVREGRGEGKEEIFLIFFSRTTIPSR